MSLEQSIEALIVALDRNTAAHGAPIVKTDKTAPPRAAKPRNPAKSEEDLVAEATARVRATEAAAEAEEDAADNTGAFTKEDVGDAVAELLKANKRKEAITLLKKFKATSVSSVAVGDYEAFIEEANTILLAA